MKREKKKEGLVESNNQVVNAEMTILRRPLKPMMVGACCTRRSPFALGVDGRCAKGLMSRLLVLASPNSIRRVGLRLGGADPNLCLMKPKCAGPILGRPFFFFSVQAPKSGSELAWCTCV